MARFGTLNRNVRVDLPAAINLPDDAPTPLISRPVAKTWMNIFGFVFYGVAVITAANLLALQIQ